MSNNLHLALVGFANAGKTTLFNALTGEKQKTGNWSGVTVSVKQGECSFANQSARLSDLPGISSLAKREQQSQDLSISLDFLANNKIDYLINVVDATQIKRQLYLTTQLRELGLPMLVVLNKSDRKEAQDIDISALAKELGCPVIRANSLANQTITDVFAALNNLKHLSQPPIALQPDKALADKLSEQSLTLLAYEQSLLAEHGKCQCESDLTQIMHIRNHFIDAALAQANLRYSSSLRLSDKIDHFILHPALGFPVFLGMMYLLFMFAINVGGAFIDFFDILAGAIFVDYPTQFLSQYGLPQWLLTLIEGVGIGIQTVATFIPIIASLFIGLSLLESSGYLARAAFVVDSIMQKVGLPGKAFVPLIVGFGCTVPAVMSARILDSERERITTVMMAPFMSCGARLPVYALFAAAFFPESGQNIVFVLYLIGIAAAVFTGLLLKATVLQGRSSDNIMELPLYEMPKIGYLLQRVWQRTRSFITGAGKTIVIVVCCLNFFNSLGTDGEFGHQDTDSSILSQGAQVITPLLAPMGVKEDNWQASVGIITGIFAKEALVATFNSLYSAKTAGQAQLAPLSELWQDATASIKENLLGIEPDDPLGTDIGDVSNIEIAAQEQQVAVSTLTTMQLAFAGQLGAFSYLLFILLYTPCAAAMGAIKNEVGTKWASFAALWSFTLAYLMASLSFQLGNFASQPAVSLTVITLVIGLFSLIYYTLKRVGSKVLTIPTKVYYS
ncbi:ferrous iron transport protein B [Thalassotalea insulae]|uniref:Ferrous iron transport protein B n=1 Tax=Thalassotalea insulae TaxID=2056778 RepID=A0ABQ6GU23_9GAMM|nr:ferrous iron transport protein B [Thalassotalea insulae]GLX78847.1 ferrous iron transport protein B [Thalassotalea insulae]